MTTRELIDHAVFTVLGLGCVGLQVAFFWGVSGLPV